MEEERKAYFSIEVEDYNPDTGMFIIDVYLILRHSKDFFTIHDTAAAIMEDIDRAIKEVKEKLIAIAENALTDIVRLANMFEKIPESRIHRDAIRGYIAQIEDVNHVVITHNLVPDTRDEKVYVLPEELRERGERLLRLLQELRAREAF